MEFHVTVVDPEMSVMRMNFWGGYYIDRMEEKGYNSGISFRLDTVKDKRRAAAGFVKSAARIQETCYEKHIQYE